MIDPAMTHGKRRTVLLATCLILCIGCQTAPRASRDELSLFEQALRLSISPDRDPLAAGEVFRLTYRLTNVSGRKVATCLGVPGGVTFWGLDSRYVEGTLPTFIDHPYCVKSLSLKAGATHVWSQEFVVPNLRPSRARMIVWVQLVSVKNCDRYGCDTTNLRASYEPVTIASPNAR
jgi:hypothetical protein